MLFVRPYNKKYFIFPGGKQESGESVEDALTRELQEELRVDAEDLNELGTTEGKTPDDRPLLMYLYSASLVGEPEPSAEIKEVAWMSKNMVMKNIKYMTPMTIDHIFPLLEELELW